MPVLLAAHPFLMKAWDKGEKEAAGRWLGRIVEGIMCFGALLTALTCIFSRELARWFLGAGFREGHFIMPIVVAGVVFWQLGMYTQKPMEFVKSTRSLVLLCLLAAAINIVSNLILVPKYGYAAAAYTTLGSYAIYFVTSLIKGRKILPWKIDTFNLLVSLTAVLAGFFAVIHARDFFSAHFNPTVSLVMVMFFCATISVFYAWHVVARLKEHGKASAVFLYGRKPNED